MPGSVLNPLDYASLGAFPTAPGTYTFTTDGVPTLTGPGVKIEGIVVDLVAVFAFDDIRVPPDMVLNSVGSRPLALLSHRGVMIDGPIRVGAGESFLGIGKDSPFPLVGGGGGGFGGAGADGIESDYGSGGRGGSPYGDLLVGLQGGSGGGAGTNVVGWPSRGGGRGGGALEVGAVGTIAIRGQGIYADGEDGVSDEICLADSPTDYGGGGGGSGGGILVHADSVALETRLSARGGNGGSTCGGGPGGGGGGGRIAVVVGSGGFLNTGTIVVAGGFPWGQARQTGHIVVRQVAPGTDPRLSIAFPGSVFDAVMDGQPYIVAWSIYDPQGILTSASLSYSLDDGGTFTPIAGCQNLPPRSGQCVWANPGPVSDLVRLRLVASSAAGQFVFVSPRGSIVTSPGGWSSADVGAVGAVGTTAYSDGEWTIDASGADIWGTADEFRYVYRPILGNFSITTRVTSIENLDRWVKAGLMIRETLSPGSRHVFLLATPRTERGIAFQRRREANGISVHTAGPAVAPPGWLTLGRVGDTIAAYYRASATDSWTLVGRETIPGLAASVLVGLAVTSHVDGMLATARFDYVAVETGLLDASEDVGGVGVPGTATLDGVVYDVSASGTDIWGTADSFRIVSHGPSSYGPNTEMTARVQSVENTHGWAKAGVMFRQSPLSPQSAHVMVVVTPGRGVAMQYRPNPGAPTVHIGVRAGIAPQWIRLTQVEGLFRGYASEDGGAWHLVGEVTLDWTGSPALAVTSHNNGVLTRAVFENVTLRRVVSP